jgi:hypothetical protein
MREDTLPLFWTAILPRRQFFNGFLDPLNRIDLTYRDSNGRRGWGLDERQLEEWRKIEQILIRAMMYLSSLVLVHLELDVGSRTVPWPSMYEYDRLFPSRSNAMSAMRSVRAVFMLKIASLTYLTAVNSKVSMSWLDTACLKQKLSLDDINLLQSCMICNNLVADPDIKRVGLIIDVRAPLDEGWQKEIDRVIEQFQPPVWMYFGPTPSANPRVCHAWYSTFMPDSSSVKGVLVNTPLVGGVRTTVFHATSLPTLLSENGEGSVRAASSLIPSYDITQPRPNRVTRQLPGEKHAAFFERSDALVREAYAKGTAIQLAKWDARRDQYKSLDCPEKTGNPTVFQWEENENGEEIRVYVGRKQWRHCFQSSSFSQRRYDPVHNEFDICEFLDPTAQDDSDGDYEEHFAIADETPITNYDAPNPPVEASNLSHAPNVSNTQSSIPPHNAMSARGPLTSDLRRSGSCSPQGDSLTSRDIYERRSRRSRSRHKRENYRDQRYREPRSRSPARDRGHPSATRERCSSTRAPSHDRRHRHSPGRDHSSNSPHRHSRPLPRHDRSSQYHRRHRPSSHRVSTSPPTQTASFRPDPRSSHRERRRSESRRERSLPMTDQPLQDGERFPTVDLCKSVQGLNIETALRCRYGLLSVEVHHDVPSILKVKYDWLGKPAKLQTVLGHWSETVPSNRVRDLHIYLAYLDLDLKTIPRLLIPPSLSDTIPSNPVGFPYLLQHDLTVRPGVIGEDTWYHVFPRVQPSRDVDYIVVVNDSLTVNQIVRQSTMFRTTYDIASYLVAFGVAFKTLLRQHVPRHLMWPSPPVPMFNAQIPLGLGVRYASDVKLSLEDYRRYLAERDQVIRSYDGRAAFLSGGIVWRLAIDALGERDRAVDGPGYYPTMKNYVVFDKSSYIDDVLTDHQEAIICGIYRILPCERYFINTSSYQYLTCH